MTDKEKIAKLEAQVKAAEELAKAAKKLSFYTDHNIVNGDWAVDNKDAERLTKALTAFRAAGKEG